MSPLSGSRSRSTPVIGGLKSKSQGAPKQKSGRIAWAEAEIAKAQKALMVTTDQMRQDAAGFMLVSDFGFQDPKAQGEIRMKKAKWKDTKRSKSDDIIPDDFFAQISEEVEKQVTGMLDMSLASSTPIPPRRVASPSTRFKSTLGGRTPSPRRGEKGAQSVEISDFVVSSADLDVTVRPDTTTTTPRRTRLQTSPDLEDACSVSDSGAPATSRSRAKTDPWQTSSNATLKRQNSSDATLKLGEPPSTPYAVAKVTTAFREPHGWQEKLAADAARNTEATPRSALLNCSISDLLEDIKDGAEASRADSESLAAVTPSMAAGDEAELFFWEREIKTEEEQEQHDMEQALWRFRKYLRNRFGSAEKAWEVLETANRQSGRGAVETARLADTLSIVEIRVALSRLGIKLPSVTGYAKVKDLIGLIDRNSSKHLSFGELMGDEETDPSLRADIPVSDRETWQADIQQPRWAINWEVGYFDKEMRERVISCDILQYHKLHSQKAKAEFLKGKREKGDQPLWQKYQATQDKKNRAREEMVKKKEEEELQECTFKPDMEYSSRSGKRILKQKQMKRACSQPIQSVHQRNLEEMLKKQNMQESETTFRPKICARSECIFSNILDSGSSCFDRLSRKEKHDRLNHVSFLTQQIKDMLKFKPETEKHEKLRKREQPVHERLFHHEKHEFWHGDKRGLHPDEEAATSTMPQWLKQNQDTDKTIGRSSMAFDYTMNPLSPKNRPKKVLDMTPAGETTLPYREQMLGIMEASERWGERVDEPTMKKWHERMGRGEAPESPSRRSESHYSSSRSPSPNPQDRSSGRGGYPGAAVNVSAQRSVAGPTSVRSLKVPTQDGSTKATQARTSTPPPARSAAGRQQEITPPRSRR